MNLGSFRPTPSSLYFHTKSFLGINQKEKDKKGKNCTVNNYGFKTPHLVLSKYSHNKKQQTHTHTCL